MGSMLNRLKDIQIDVLREVGNIGAGNAATALSTMIQKPIDMNVPNVKILPFSEIEEFLGGEDQVVIGIFLRVEGDVPGNMLYIMALESAKQLIKHLLDNDDNDDKENNQLTEIELSALNEVGNILVGSYLSSLADFTKLNLSLSVPSMTIDMVGSIISFGLIQTSQYSDVAIVINTSFLEEQEDILGHFFLIPDPDAFDKLFSALGVPLE